MSPLFLLNGRVGRFKRSLYTWIRVSRYPYNSILDFIGMGARRIISREGNGVPRPERPMRGGVRGDGLRAPSPPC